MEDDGQIDDDLVNYEFFLDPDEMPSGKSGKGQRPKSNGSDRQKKDAKGQKSSFRKAFRAPATEEKRDPNEDKRKHDEKLLSDLSDVIWDYSQQRMRALHMSFRLYGNDEMRMTHKEMMQSCQENNVTIPSIILKPLICKFDGSKGIDLEAMFRFLTEAHNRTGRDSVLALHTRNDLAPRNNVSQEEIDDDLLWRIESQLVKSHEYIDIKQLRAELQKRDTSKSGKIDKTMMQHVCQEIQLPIFGALLKNLMKRCAEQSNQKVRWPEFLSFLEKGQKNAWKSCPHLTSLPEQRKNRTPAVPSPLDELSVKARENIVNKLRSKSVMSRRSATPSQSNNDDGDSNYTVTNNEDNKSDKGIGNADEQRSTTSKPEKPSSHDKDSSVFEETGDMAVAEKAENAETELAISTEKPKADAPRNAFEELPRERRKFNLIDFVLKIIKGNKECRGKTKVQSLSDKADDKKIQPQVLRNVKIDIKIEEPSDADTPSRTPPDVASVDDTLTGYEITLPDDVITAMSTLDDENDKEEGVQNTPNTDSKTQTQETSSSKNMGNIEESKEANSQTGQDTVVAKRKESCGELVTVHAGQIVSVKTQDDVADRMSEPAKTEGFSTKLTMKIKDTTVTFDTNEEFLTQQTIDPPTERMKLQWVYGYRGNDCRKNIHILGNGDVLYFMSYIAIMYNKEAHIQRHYREHTDDIKCIDVHSNRIIVASGQYANRKNPQIKAHIRVWRSDTLNTLYVMGVGMFEKSIACVAFAPGQDLLAAVDNSLEKKLTIWDTSTGDMRGEDLLHTDLVCDIGFNTKYPETLITVGKEHTCWWKVYPASCTVQASAKPEYETFLRAKFTICLAFNDKGDMITGDSNGTIYIFADGGNRITNYIKHAHDGPVFTILYHKGFILSGGRDGIIHCWQWTKDMDSSGFMQIQTEGGIRMLRIFQSSVLVGTTMNSLMVISNSNGYTPLQGAQLDEFPLTQCHYDDLRGLTIVRNSSTDVLTAGLDGIICGYNSNNRTSTFKIQFKGYQYVCIDADEKGSLLVLGTKDGHLQIMIKLEKTWQKIVDRKLCKDRIECIRLSQDGLHVAAGSRDSTIYLYSYQQKDDGMFIWDYAGRLKGHTGPINAIDWSQEKLKDRYLLRSSSGPTELRYWQPSTTEDYTKQVSKLDIKWATQSVFCDVSVVGMMASKFTKETDVTSLAVHDPLGVTGDNCGNISLFQYPCSQNGAFCHTYRSHACVQSMGFSMSGKYLMTTGGRDSCLMQWSIV